MIPSSNRRETNLVLGAPAPKKGTKEAALFAVVPVPCDRLPAGISRASFLFCDFADLRQARLAILVLPLLRDAFLERQGRFDG
jgi:hypothetical protein